VSHGAQPLYRRALLERARTYLDGHNRGARSRLALAKLLRRAGYFISLVSVRGWTRHEQGEAYLWAVAFLAGREDLPVPQCVRDASR
jgi:hypothetical protein